MNPFLLEHAIKNVWCTPEQDKQYIFEGGRHTPNGGVKGSFNYALNSITMPDNENRFHVYMFGAFSAGFYNVTAKPNIWYPLPRMCRENSVYIDIYYQHGIHYPLHLCWMMRTLNGNHVIAVMINPMFPSLNLNSLHFRFYSNSFFGTLRNTNNDLEDEIRVIGRTLQTESDVVEISNRFALLEARPGHVMGFVNGEMVNRLSPVSMQLGDVVEMVYDSTIKGVYEYSISDLEHFTSTLDSKNKLIISGSPITTDTIEYQDDLEVYLYVDENNGIKRGVYYHRNAVDAMRMLTHKDYSLVASYVAAYVNSNDFLQAVGFNGVKVKLLTRHSGYKRAIVNEHHRIKELYKLSPTQIEEAMTGVHSSILEWTAAELEASTYTKLMRLYKSEITPEMVVDAYGYNAISKLVGDTPTPVTTFGGVKIVTCPLVAQPEASIWEYDVNGLLVNIGHHAGNDYFPVKNNTAVFCEVITGKSGFFIDDVYGSGPSPYDVNYDHRFYRCPKVNSIPTNEWEDVTGEPHYSIVNGQVVWDLNTDNWLTLVRSDRNVLAYEFDILRQSGLLFFNIESQFKRDGELVRDVNHVPYMRVEIWLNGHPLVNGIDCIIDYPRVVVINRRFLTQSETQHIAVRCYGLAPIDDDNKPYVEPISESGFVDYGVVSRNGTFNLRDDKVMRYVVGGRVYKHDQLPFMEDKPGMVNASVLNNLPYAVYDHYVPLRDYTPDMTSTIFERNRSKDLDGRISAYLTVKLPEDEPDIPSMSEYLYPLVSPFMSRVVSLLVGGVITFPQISPLPSNGDIEDLLEEHLEWLQYDPIRNGLYADNTIILPHPYLTANVSITQFIFLKKVNELYLENKIELERYFTIVQ